MLPHNPGMPTDMSRLSKSQLLMKSDMRSPCNWPALGASPRLRLGIEFHAPPQSATTPESGPVFVAVGSICSSAARARTDGSKISIACRG